MSKLRLITASVLIPPVGAVMLAASTVVFALMAVVLPLSWLANMARRFLERLLGELGIATVRRGQPDAGLLDVSDAAPMPDGQHEGESREHRMH